MLSTFYYAVRIVRYFKKKVKCCCNFVTLPIEYAEPCGMGISKLSSFIERTLKVPVIFRYWRTVEVLAVMAGCSFRSFVISQSSFIFATCNFDCSGRLYRWAQLFFGAIVMAKKRIILIHGRAIKPAEQPMRELARDAVINGLTRANSKVSAELIRQDGIKFDLVYFGDIINQIQGEAR